MTPIQEFMSRVVPWPEGNTSGYVNLHWRAVNPKDKEKYWGGKATTNLKDFLSTTSWALQRNFIQDLYFCTSLQGQIGKNSKGNPKVLRSKDLAVALKAIWLDVDVKEAPKGYPTLEAALGGVAKFVLEAGLPHPTALIATGGGLHVYWISDRPLPVAVWQPYADGLKTLAIKHGLLCDAGVTSDAARILRIPGTLNYKSDPPRPVRVLGIKPVELDYDFGKTFSFLAELAPISKGSGTTTARTTLQGSPVGAFAALTPESLSQGIGYEDIPLDWKPIAVECGFIKEALRTGGKEYSQPMWNLTTLAATFMEDGHALAHKMGNKHPDYTVESTEALWARKNRERKDRGLGWPSCAAIQAAGCQSCASCPHFSKGKSPLNLGAPVQKVEAATGEVSLVSTPENELHLPFGYKVNKEGLICKLEAIKGKAGEAGDVIEVPLFHNRISDPKVEAEPKALSFTVTTDKGHTERVTLLAENIVNGTEMWKLLQRQGVLPVTSKRASAEEFLMAWLAKLQEAKEATQSTPFGWYRTDGKRNGFVYGGKIMKDDGTEVPAGNGDRSLRKLYSPTGTIQPWFDAFKVIADQHRPELEVIVAAAFAAPLIVTPAEYNCMLACWGASAAFKSTAMKVGLAVWGHPKMTKEVTKSTSRSVLHKMGEIKNLPLYWDEIREETLQQLYDVFFDATLGVGPGRLTSNIVQRDKSDWQTMMVTGSNYNFVDFLANMQKSTDAGIYRVFEYEIKKPAEDAPGMIGTMDASRIMQELEANYGVIGMAYAKMLSGAPMDIDEYTKSVCEDFAKKVSPTKAERFWIATCGTLLAGANLANQIGATFDTKAMEAFLIEEYHKNRERRRTEAVEGGTEVHAEEVLSNFLRDKLDHSMYTDTFPQGRGKPPVISTHHAPRLDSGKGVEVQWATKDAILRFSRLRFRDYLKQQKIPVASVMRGLTEHFGMYESYAMLGANTPWAVGQAHLLCIPVKEGTSLHSLMMVHKPLTTQVIPTGLPPKSPQTPPAPSE